MTIGRRVVAFLALFTLILSAASCGGGDDKGDPRKNKGRSSKKSAPKDTAARSLDGLGPTGGKVDLASPATIKGMIKLGGEAPKRKKVDLSKDKWCSDNHEVLTEEFVVDANGGLRDVCVYLEGLDSFGSDFPAPAAPARLVQKGCTYIPRVLTARVGQEVEIVNADDTSHNYHYIGRNNDEVNKTQPKPTTDIHVFENAETNGTFRCDIHGWMLSRVFVFEHPCFTVSAEDGSFEISGVPPGTYRLVFDHGRAKAGALDRKVTVTAGQALDLGDLSVSR